MYEKYAQPIAMATHTYTFSYSVTGSTSPYPTVVSVIKLK